MVASVGACKKKKKGTGGGGSSWIVGQDGAMIRLDGDTGAVADYTLETDADLLDIACRGIDAAWVVGERGTALRTLDGGDSWEALDIGYEGSLRAVAVASHDFVFAAGDGPLLASNDSGDSWRAIADSDGAWTSVATNHDGSAVVATTAGGDIYQYIPTLDSIRLVYSGRAPLHGVAMTPDGASAIAVGEDVVVESDDGGFAWYPRVDTDGINTLRGVQLGASGELAIALGDAGTIAYIGAEGVEAEHLVDADLALRALHVSVDGAIVVVGDGGAALVSDDMGETWTDVDLGTDASWFGVDNLHGEPHL
jgi:hypothetical protein